MKKKINFIRDDHKVFPGYGHHEVPDQFFKYPMILEEYWYTMTGAEQKVLTFILRKTYGWQKQRDKISLSQFTDGDATGFGTGLSRSQVKRAIDSLEERNFIKVTRHYHQPSIFELPLNDCAVLLNDKGVFKDSKKIKHYQAYDNGEYKKSVLEAIEYNL